MNVFLRWAGLLAVAILIAGVAANRYVRAQGQQESDAERTYRTSMEDADQKIVAEEHAHSELMKNLEYLTTQIGPRLTGSKQMQDASAWTLKRFQDYGIDAHLEHAEVAHAFIRGVDTAEITAPLDRRIGIRSLGWSKATDGTVAGSVVMLESQTPEAIAAAGAKLKGAIVLMGKPSTLPTDEHPDNAYDAVIAPQRGVPAARGGGDPFAGARGCARRPLADSGRGGVAARQRKTVEPF